MSEPTEAVKGRPTSYTPELANHILLKLAEGVPLRQICKAKDMPPESTVRQWVIDNRDGFSALYATARSMGLDAMAEETLEIADDGSGDEWVDNDGNVRTNHDVIARSRLRVDTRKWLLSKMRPDIYGDKQKIEHSGELPALVVRRET